MLEVIHGSPVFNLGTGLGPNYTGEGWAPVLDVLHVLLEPRGVVSDVVLPVRPTIHLCASAARCDCEPERGEPKKESDEEYDGDEVQPQRPGDMEAGAHKASKRDEEHDEANDEERRLQDRRARGRGALGQPEPRPDDRNRGEESGQVEVANHHVAHAVRVHL